MAGKQWTMEEDRILEECFLNSDKPYNEAVRRLDRSRQAIRNRAYYLGLTRMYKSDKEDEAFTDVERWDMCNKILNLTRGWAGIPQKPTSENPYRKIQEV